LNGKRPLTAEHINKLAATFRLPHELFFEPLEVV
jgi:antitoxin component HigA of HigAB toxin-antitoxin module